MSHQDRTPQNFRHVKENIGANASSRRATPDEVAYREGYVHGKTAQRDAQHRYGHGRNNNGMASGILIGVVLASLVGIAVGTFSYLLRDAQTTTVESTSTPIDLDAQQPEPVNRETTVIERTVDRTQEVVPVAPAETDSGTTSAPQTQQPNYVQPSTTQPTDTQPNGASSTNTPAIEPSPQSADSTNSTVAPATSPGLE